jgi:hypothetical protein
MDGDIKAPDVSDTDIAKEYEGSNLNIRKAGLIRIPICGPEEATANLNKGRHYYGDSLNFPCNA